MQVVLVYLQPFRRNLVLKCTLHPKIAKKFTNPRPFLLGVQGRSRPSTLMSPVLVIISSMPVRICNRFHTIRANNGKITSF